jgi:hypothetical protein
MTEHHMPGRGVRRHVIVINLLRGVPPEIFSIDNPRAITESIPRLPLCVIPGAPCHCQVSDKVFQVRRPQSRDMFTSWCMLHASAWRLLLHYDKLLLSKGRLINLSESTLRRVFANVHAKNSSNVMVKSIVWPFRAILYPTLGIRCVGQRNARVSSRKRD